MDQKPKDLKYLMRRSSKGWMEIDGDITSAAGYRAAAVIAGIKQGSSKKDLALLCSESPAWGAAVFTRNRVAAAPVQVSREMLAKSRGRVRAIVVNSGNANACTGRQGMRDAVRMTTLVAEKLELPPSTVLVASTGVIGQRMPMHRIAAATPRVVESLSRQGGADFSEAILTTDTRKKICVVRCRFGRSTVTVAGTAKGSGMIQPHMATMLAFIATDAAISSPLLRRALRSATAVSFNRLTVDGDTSTNDCVFLVANGASGAPRISSSGKAFGQFRIGLEWVCASLARQIARDGEGARKLLEVCVTGGRHEREAERVARAIANSPLVKTAMAGADANWGRIICAAGYSGVALDPARVNISLNGLQVCRRGQPVAFDERHAKSLLAGSDILIEVSLNRGISKATIWSCDLTEDYIKINASYRS